MEEYSTPYFKKLHFFIFNVKKLASPKNGPSPAPPP